MKFARSTLSSELGLKAHVLQHLRLSQKISPATVVINELAVGSRLRRADIVTVDRQTTAYEIKSAADKLTRLHGQTEAFLKVFDRVVVVVAACHSSSAVVQALPREAGVWEVKSSGVIRELRKGGASRRLASPFMLSLLPLEELRRFARRSEFTCHRASRQEITKACLKMPIRTINTELVAYLSAAFKATTDNFWRIVGSSEIEPSHLAALSRFAARRRQISSDREQHALFWNNWHGHATTALRAIAARPKSQADA